MALIEDHGLQRGKPERSDQQRQPKLGAAEADQPAKRADQSPAAERGNRAAGGDERRVIWSGCGSAHSGLFVMIRRP
jgi:hypothetical protein